jgi:hypothetical protein
VELERGLRGVGVPQKPKEKGKSIGRPPCAIDDFNKDSMRIIFIRLHYRKGNNQSQRRPNVEYRVKL